MLNLVFNSGYPNVAFDVIEGCFYRIKPCGTPIRKLEQNDTGMINVLVKDTQKNTNRKASMLAWEFISASPVPDGYVVYHKNMDVQCIKGNNLGTMPKEKYKELKDALSNVDGTLKLFPDGKEVYCYKVRYKHEGKTKWIRFDDVVSAKRFKRMLMIASTKLIARYTVTE